MAPKKKTRISRKRAEGASMSLVEKLLLSVDTGIQQLIKNTTPKENTFAPFELGPCNTLRFSAPPDFDLSLTMLRDGGSCEYLDLDHGRIPARIVDTCYVAGAGVIPRLIIVTQRGSVQEIKTNLYTNGTDSCEKLRVFTLKEQPTQRQQAMQWWNSLASAQKTRICDLNTARVGRCRRWESLTGREIETLFNDPTVRGQV